MKLADWLLVLWLVWLCRGAILILGLAVTTVASIWFLWHYARDWAETRADRPFKFNRL